MRSIDVKNLVIYLIIGGMLCCSLFIFISIFMGARRVGQMSTAYSRLKQLYVGITAYKEKHGRLPPLSDCEALEAALYPAIITDRAVFIDPMSGKPFEFEVGGSSNPSMRPYYIEGKAPIACSYSTNASQSRLCFYPDGRMQWLPPRPLK